MVTQTVLQPAIAGITGGRLAINDLITDAEIANSAANEILAGGAVYSAAYIDAPAATYRTKMYDGSGNIVWTAYVTLTLTTATFQASEVSSSGGGGGGDATLANQTAILARLPAALVSGRMDSSTGAMATDVINSNAVAGTAVTELQAGLATSAALATAQADLTTLVGRITAARAGYWDNLNVGGVVASQADINALNQSASRRIIFTTVGQYERPESGSTVYTVEARTYDGDGAAVNADSNPTMTGTGVVTGSLAGNIGAITNPATGVYRWTYTVATAHNVEPIRFDVSATIAAVAFPMSLHTQVVDEVSKTWTTTDANNLTAIFNKLPSRGFITGATAATGALVTADVGLATANLDTQIATLATGAALTTVGGNVTTLINRLGAWAGTGINTVLGAFRAIAAKAAALTPTDISTGTTFNNTTHSLENIKDTAGGGGGGGLDAAGTRAALGMAAPNLDSQLAGLAALWASSIAAMKVATAVSGFPNVIVRNADYSTALDSSILLTLTDLTGAPITQIGGVAVASLTWLAGMGTDNDPHAIPCTAAWGGTGVRVTWPAAATAAIALGPVSWQVGCQIGAERRFIGGGITRLVERQYL